MLELLEGAAPEKSEPVVAEQQAQETASAEVKPEADSPPKEADSAAQETKKALKGVQKRIDELTRARYEAEERGKQEADRWRQEAENYRAQLAQIQANKPPPKSDQFQDYEQYLQALAGHQASQVTEARIQQERQAAAEWQRNQYEAQQKAQAQAQYQQTIATKVDEAVKKFPDFIDVVTSPELPGMQGTPAFGAILESEMGAEVMYHLGQNPLKAHQIVSLSPLGQVREIGKIEAALAAGKSVSNAPPPVSSVNTKTGSATQAPRSIDEYYAQITRGRSKT